MEKSKTHLTIYQVKNIQNSKGGGYKMKTILTYVLSMTIIITMVFTIVPSEKVHGTSDKVSKPTHIKASKKSSTSIRLSWSKVTDSNGYIIYRKSPGKKKYKKIKTISKSSKTKWTNKKLKKNKTYRYKIKAYKKVNGKKRYSKFSYSVSCKTYTKKSKSSNVKKVSVYYKNRYTGTNAYKKVSPDVKTKKKGKAPISKKIRWYSSDKSIATVDKKGGIKTKDKQGKCSIYAIAHNGVKTKLNITTKDYANPSSFSVSNKLPSVVKTTLTKNKDDLCEIADYLEGKKGYCDIVMRNGHMVSDIEFKHSMMYKMEDLLKEGNVTGIQLLNGNVTFYVNYAKYGDAASIQYWDYNAKSIKGANKLADCWFYFPPTRGGGD